MPNKLVPQCVKNLIFFTLNPNILQFVRSKIMKFIPHILILARCKILLLDVQKKKSIFLLITIEMVVLNVFWQKNIRKNLNPGRAIKNWFAAAQGRKFRTFKKYSNKKLNYSAIWRGATWRWCGTSSAKSDYNKIVISSLNAPNNPGPLPNWRPFWGLKFPNIGFWSSIGVKAVYKLQSSDILSQCNKVLIYNVRWCIVTKTLANLIAQL